MPDDDVSKTVEGAICRIGCTTLPPEILESYELAAGLTYPISKERDLYEQVVSKAKKEDLTDPDLSGFLVAVGLSLQGFPIESPSDAVEQLHLRVVSAVSSRGFPLPNPPLVVDLTFGGESRRSALADSASFGATTCGRAAEELRASWSLTGLLAVSWIQGAVRECDASLPGHTGLCGEAARRAYARAFLAHFVGDVGRPDPDAPITGPFETRAERIAKAGSAGRIAAEFAYWACQRFAPEWDVVPAPAKGTGD